MAIRKYILVDTENVGRHLPNLINKEVKIVYFVQNATYEKTLKETIKSQYNKIPRAFGIINIEKYEHKANCMDMCITKYALELAIKKNNIKIDILSKDKGFDEFIKYIKKASNTNVFQRIEELPCFVNTDLLKTIPVDCNFNETILNAAIECRSMEQLRAVLSKKQRKDLLILNYMNDITGKNIQMEYDLYNKQYNLYQNGNCKVPLYTSKNENACKERFNEIKQEIEDNASYFKTKENYCAVKSLNALKIVNKGLETKSLSYEYLEKNIADTGVFQKVATLILN